MAVEVKICGLTRPEDAEAAVAAGAAYLGVVFASGPRVITPERAAEISARAGGTPVLGVFGVQSVARILDTARLAGLRGAQLHGDHTAEEAAALRAEGLMVWRVVRIAASGDLDRVARAAAGADAVLVEPRVPGSDGGAGVPLDLALAREARVRLSRSRMVLAGGLTPETVGRAATLVRPDVVDVSSGVETLPGVKDPAKIAAFLEAVFGPSAIP